ncbi:hypothetical protein Agub_g276, partial [Astrephomene gubernaculifera]
LRALARSAVEALLESGLPCYAHAMPRPGGGGGSSRSLRSSIGDLGSGAGTPRNGGGLGGGGNTSYGLLLGAGTGRRSVMLGADGLDEEEEEQLAAAAAAAAGPAGRATWTGGAPPPLSSAMTVVEPYLQPPEVRGSVRPSVLYVTVPSLPRGSLVEIQPVCLDVEALAVTRKLAGDSFSKRRNSCQQDPSLAQTQPQPSPQPSPSHLPHMPPSPPPHSRFGHAGTLGASVSGVSAWNDLAGTPRASLDIAVPGRHATTGAVAAAPAAASGGSMTHGSAPASWQEANDVQGVPLPSHVLSAAGYMTPDAGGSLVGTPCAVPSLLSRQRGSGNSMSRGSVGGAGSESAANRSGNALNADPAAQQQGSAPELVSEPTLQHNLPEPDQLAEQQQGSQQQQQQQQQQPFVDSSGASVLIPRRHRLSSNGGEGVGSAGAGAGSLSAVAASRLSNGGPGSGSGSSSSSNNAVGGVLPRGSLDGSILSFEISSGRAPVLPALAAALPSSPAHTGAAVLAQEGPRSAGSGSANNSGPLTRVRPSAIMVPPVAVPPSGPVMQSGSFHCLAARAAAAAEVTTEATGALANLLASQQQQQQQPQEQEQSLHDAVATVVAASMPPLLRVPAPVNNNSGGTYDAAGGSQVPGGSGGAGTPLLEAAAAAAVPPGSSGGASAAASPGAGNASDVMVTTVCCYGLVLRSLFHLPPAVFARGVTTAQLTRRFRRAAASVLAAHGMGMSCLIRVCVWYDKKVVELTDDEYGYRSPSSPAAGGSLTSGGGAVQHALDDPDGGSSAAVTPTGSATAATTPASIGGRGSGGGADGSGSNMAALAAAAAAALGTGGGGCGSPRAASSAAAMTRLTAAAHAASGGGAAASSPVANWNPSRSPQLCSPAAGAAASPGLRPASPMQDHAAAAGPGGQPSPGPQGPPPPAPPTQQQQQQQPPFHVTWVPVQRVATNASPQPTQCVAVLELLAALPVQ